MNRGFLPTIPFLLVLFMLSVHVMEASDSGSPTTASKDGPFVNSLGMKFVPVPGTKILMCVTETTVQQYQAADMSYRAPTFAQGPAHPAVCVSQSDAKTWCQRISKKEGRRYRLPTNAEWSAAVGQATYPWGENWPPTNNSGNYCGQEFKSAEAMALAKSQGVQAKDWSVIRDFRDRHVFTAPVGSYIPNHLGIFDLGGNVWEWLGDKPMLRGGSWYDHNRSYLASSFRSGATPGLSYNDGFRCVLAK